MVAKWLQVLFINHGACQVPTISKRVVDGALPGATLWDDRIPRFGLRVSNSGSKTYVLKFRLHGRQRWHTIGHHGKPKRSEDADAPGRVWTAEAARSEALRLLGLIESGIDPAQEKAHRRRAETLNQFAVRYVQKHVEANNKPRSVEETKRLLERTVLPKLGKYALRELTREHVRDFHASLKQTPYLANRCLSLVAHMLGKAEEWGDLSDGSTICRRLPKFKEKARTRYLSGEEVTALGLALDEAERSGLNMHALTIIRLLLLTGARRKEIEALRWDEIQLERGVLELSDSKTGEKTVNLPQAAREILKAYPREHGSPFVFPAASIRKPKAVGTNERPAAHYQGLNKVWMEVRKRAGLDDVRLHDLRHTYASFAVAGGLSLPLVGALLGHKRSATTERYAHLADDPIRSAADQVGDVVANALGGALKDAS